MSSSRRTFRDVAVVAFITLVTVVAVDVDLEDRITRASVFPAQQT